MSDAITDIVEDSTGGLWVSTREGVSRYDGVSWKSYTEADGLAHDYVMSIVIDRSGSIWFGTLGGGISRFDGAEFRTFTTADGLAGNEVFDLLVDRRGNIWAACDQGVSQYAGDTLRSFTVADGLATNLVWSIFEDRAGGLWFGTGGGPTRFDGTSWERLNVPNAGSARAIIQDRKGALWFAGNVAVSRYDGIDWTFFYESLPCCLNTDLLEDARGDLWVSTWGGGVARYDGFTWKTVTTADGLSSPLVDEIFDDSAGALWFGTNGGADRYDGVTWTSFTAPQAVYDIERDRTGALWFGSLSGVTRFDGLSWQTFTIYNTPLAANDVRTICEDSSGALWFGTGGGVSRYDGTSWLKFTTMDGLVHDGVWDILQDRSGALWFATGGGISRYDGHTWQSYTTQNGLLADFVDCGLEDRDGHLWFGTTAGASRFDGNSWRHYGTGDGLPGSHVTVIFEDQAGVLWFGTETGGLGRYGGSSWQTYARGDGLPSNGVLSIAQEENGRLWFGTTAGATVYDGIGWKTFGPGDGLHGNWVMDIHTDSTGALWFAQWVGGVTHHRPDRVAPQTVITGSPPVLSSNRFHTITLALGFKEIDRAIFSWSLDNEAWSNWTSDGFSIFRDLPDGHHTFRARSRDEMGNVDATPARVDFEIDATAPAPVITFPSFGQVVRGSLVVLGRAADDRFRDRRLEYRAVGSPEWEARFIEPSGPLGEPIWDGVLATLNTDSLSDGAYELKLSATDTLGLTGTYLVSVVVDNQRPFAEVTTPVKVAAATGGDVYATNGEVHLYFSPHAFREDALVTIIPAAPGSVPDKLVSGATLVLTGYEVSWGSASLEKPVRLEFSYAGVDPAGLSGPLALYVTTDGTNWRRLGGTLEPGANRIALAVSEPGRYALYAGRVVTEGEGTLSSLSFTPRVFSPAGTFANDHVAIGFTLGRAAAVTVRVYTRGGRLVREVASGQAMGPGANLVRWDGRDRGGGEVADGVYVVTVEALGQTRRNALAVVR